MVERFQVDCRGMPARAEVAGRGPALVMVGAAVSMAWTRPYCATVAELGYRVLNFDYQVPDGWVGEPEPRSSLDQVEDVIMVMVAAGFARAHVVGISRGAITAFGLAARRPELVETLTLACPVAGFADTIYKELQIPPGEDGADRMTVVLQTVFSSEFLGTNLEEAKALLRAPSGTVVRLERSEEDPFADGDQVVAPTLVLEAGADQVVQAEHPARYLAAIPNSKHVRIEAASHVWPTEQPAKFARIVADFVKSAGRT